MHKLGGVFILLAAGVLLAIVVAVLEHFLNKRKKQRKAKNRVSNVKYDQNHD